MGSADESTFTLPELPRFLRALPHRSSVPEGDSVRQRWAWVNPHWIGAVLGTAPL
ncbi:hypothetical protein [Nocardia wallacei]|uniref:hypothetical protein n=1 Tax=Nocardia wallacei TaxID=480035 RepID=UPI002458B35E|nr:hypothetical protein [Nocardia wallacei]